MVKGPVATMVTGVSLSRSTFAISATERRGDSGIAGSGKTGPSSPLCPWTEGAFIGLASSGAGFPIATGARMPSSVQTRCAL